MKEHVLLSTVKSTSIYTVLYFVHLYIYVGHLTTSSTIAKSVV